jgi:TPR repeat protein
MKKTSLSFVISSLLLLSFNTQAETFETHSSISVINKPLLSIEEVAEIKVHGIDGVEDYIQLGDFYSYNKEYRDTFEAFNHYKKASVLGSEYATLMLGYMTYKGYGTDKNIFKGEHLLRNVKKPYDKNALYLLGKLYMESGEREKAIEIFKVIKDPQSYTYLTKSLIQLNRFDEAIPYLNWLIEEENDSYAKRELALIYFRPDFKNESKAVSLMTSSAEQGDSTAQYQLGLYYQQGTKTTIANMKKAVRWYTIASQNDNSFATQELLKIWNENIAYDNKYGIDNDPYLIKIVSDQYVKEHH